MCVHMLGIFKDILSTIDYLVCYKSHIPEYSSSAIIFQRFVKYVC